jgi:acetyl esterase
MLWFYSQYVNDDADRYDIRFSPLLGQLHNLPAAMIIAAEYDPIRDQGRIYYEALRAYGNKADYRLYPRQPHGFLSMAGISSQADHAYTDMAYFLRE